MSASAGNVSFVHPLQSKWGYAALLFILAGISISAFKLSSPYSYWVDELYSVTASKENLISLHRILLSDLHPPLYQLLLKGWMSVFGDSEVSTRSLSWLFAIASIYPLWKFSKNFGVVFFVCSLVVFSTNVLFTYYANEARPYAMELFFATLVSTYYFEESNKRLSPKFLIACLALSLSHYFGLILVGVILGFRLFESRANRDHALKILGTGVLAGLWPLHHALNGAILGKTGGNFSIKVNGFTDSFG
ncbi:MAG: glycosyltransferase family 39 protein, partial [Nitrospirales bacterium]